MTVRRSTRARTKTSYDEDSDVDEQNVGQVHMDDVTYLKTGDDDGQDEEESSSSEEEDVNDDDYVMPGSKKRPRAAKGSRQAKKGKRVTSPESTKQSNSSSKKEQEQYIAMENECKPTELFQILGNSNEVSVEELASDWLDLYQNGRNLALSNLLNFLLDCAGSLTHIGEHDVANNESSNETIGEIQIMFQEQKIHEFHLFLSKTNNKRAKHKPLYENFIEFMDKLMELAYEKEMIYVESEKDDEHGEISVETSPLIVDLLTWIPSLSVSKIRSLRYVSTLAIFTFQNNFSLLATDLDTNVLFKLRKQLALEQKKKRPNKKTLESIESSISDAQATKTVIENNMDNIIKLCFVHRFKDVDENIRSEAIAHLAGWMENNPEYFFKVTFLKYFGWLLSDSSNNVRLQAIKTLNELIKFSNKRNKSLIDNTALRQFFERFKDRILEIAFKDIDVQVRLTAVQVLSLINNFGYLDDSEILQITSLIFFDREVKVSSTSRDVKFLNEVSKFFSAIVTEKTSEYIDVHEDILPKKIEAVNPEQLAETGILMRMLNNSLSKYLLTAENSCSSEYNSDKARLLFQASEFLYHQFNSLIQPIARLLCFEGEFSLADNDETTESTNLIDMTDLKLLLPIEDSQIVFYVTVLGGLCTGGVNYNKGQDLLTVAHLVLPELHSLFVKLNLDADQIYTQLLNMVQLFDATEWDSNEQKNGLDGINQIILKKFLNSPVSLSIQDPVTSIYKKIIPYLASSKWVKISDSWKSLMTDIILSLGKYLETFDIEEENSGITLYLQYINKLLLFSKEFPIELTDDNLNALLNKFVEKIPKALPILDFETLLTFDFRIFTSIVSWSLEKWLHIIRANENPVAVSHNTLKQNKLIIESLFNTCVELNLKDDNSPKQKFHLLANILSALLDSNTALKMFELSLPEKESSWKRALRQEYSVNIDALPKLCYEVFLYLEGCLATKMGVSLNRVDDEDVNFNDISLLDPSDDEEKELCLFMIKVKGISKLGLMHSNQFEERILLNREILGTLYSSIVDETIFDEGRKKKVQKRVNRAIPEPAPIEDHEDEVLEPIEEFTQDDIFHSPRSEPDPIESSSL